MVGIPVRIGVLRNIRAEGCGGRAGHEYFKDIGVYLPP